MSSEPEVERCPFCGSEGRIREDLDAWTPECSNDDCPLDYVNFPWFWDRADALKAWNTRVKPEPGPALKAFIDLIKPIVAKLDDRAAVTCKASQLRELIAELEADDV